MTLRLVFARGDHGQDASSPQVGTHSRVAVGLVARQLLGAVVWAAFLVQAQVQACKEAVERAVSPLVGEAIIHDLPRAVACGFPRATARRSTTTRKLR